MMKNFLFLLCGVVLAAVLSNGSVLKTVKHQVGKLYSGGQATNADPPSVTMLSPRTDLVLSPTPVPPLGKPVTVVSQQEIDDKQAAIGELEAIKSATETQLEQLRRLQDGDQRQLEQLRQLLTSNPATTDKPNIELSIKALDYFAAARKHQIDSLNRTLLQCDQKLSALRLALLATRANAAEIGVTELVDELVAFHMSPRAAFAKQFALLLSGDLESLKLQFSDEEQSAITAEQVQDARRVFMQQSLASVGHDFIINNNRDECRILNAAGVEIGKMTCLDGQWTSTRVWFQ